MTPADPAPKAIEIEVEIKASKRPGPC